MQYVVRYLYLGFFFGCIWGQLLFIIGLAFFSPFWSFALPAGFLLSQYDRIKKDVRTLRATQWLWWVPFVFYTLGYGIGASLLRVYVFLKYGQ